MPQYILLLINKKTGKIVSATFAYTSAERTMITREKENEEHYVKVFECDYSMRRDMVQLPDRKPRYILMLANKEATALDPTNFSSATFACDLEEVSEIVNEHYCSQYNVKVMSCDDSMREE